MDPLRRHPPSVQEARDRVEHLLSVHDGRDPGWQQRSIDLAEQTTTLTLFTQHPALAALRSLDRGTLPGDPPEPLAQRYPLLADETFSELINLNLPDADDDADPAGGPASDFDPLNSTPFASVVDDDIWFSVVAIPDEPLTRWPVIECTPEGSGIGYFVLALDIDHFFHHYFCCCHNDSLYASPLTETDEPLADALAAVCSRVLGVSPVDALGLRTIERNPNLEISDLPDPYFPASLTDRLLRLAVPQPD